MLSVRDLQRPAKKGSGDTLAAVCWVRLSRDVVEHLKRQARAADITKSEAIRRAIVAGLAATGARSSAPDMTPAPRAGSIRQIIMREVARSGRPMRYWCEQAGLRADYHTRNQSARPMLTDRAEQLLAALGLIIVPADQVLPSRPVDASSAGDRT